MANNSVRRGSWELFGLLILASALIHLLFIFFFPGGYLLRTTLFGPEPIAVSTPIVFEFVGIGDEVQELAKTQELLKEQQADIAEAEEEQEEEEVPEKKRQQFVDTADSAVDEEVDVETDKIGEMGTLAADTTPDEGPETEEPRLEGDTEMLSIGGPPGQGPGYAGEIAEMLAGVVGDIEETVTEVEETEAEQTDITESEELAADEESPEVIEEGEDTEIVEEGEEVVEAETEEAPPETTVPEEGTPPDEVALKEEAPSETESEQTGESETPEKGSYLERKLGLLDEPLEKDEDGFLSVEERAKEKPKELAYIPPEEPRERKAQKKYKKRQRPVYRNGVKPTVALGFNAKTLAGGTVEPLYNSEDGNVTREGKEAFSVMKDLYAPYYRHIRDRISWYWVLKYGTRAEINLETKPKKPIIIQFKVLPNGRTGEVKIVDVAGNNLLASYIKDTISEARMDEFPSYVEEQYIDVRFNFYFF